MSGSTPVDETTSHPQSSSQSSGSISCGSCGASNPAGGQFCAGCGHALYEPCAGCSKPVLLSQSFCGTCGCDLIAAVKQKLKSLETKIGDAIAAAKQLDFEKSSSLLKLVARETDFRFKEVVAQAKIAQQKIDSIASRESESASDRIDAALCP
mgnify:FL=1